MPHTRLLGASALVLVSSAVGCLETTSSRGASAIVASLQPPGSSYAIEVVDLAPHLGGDAEVADINDAGHLAGAVEGHAFLWSAEVGLVDIGALVDGDASRATALNNRGEVVGNSGFSHQSVPRAFRWTRDGGLRALPVFEEAFRSVAADVNDNGQVVGLIVTSRPNAAVLWEPDGTIVELGELRPGCGCGADPQSISSDGVVAGIGFDIPPSLGLVVSRAFVWSQAEGMRSLGTLGYEGPFTESVALGINSLGHIVGESDGAAFRWTPQDGMQDLRVPVSNTARARDVNDGGYVVGTALGFPDIDGDRGFVLLPSGEVLVLAPLGLGRHSGGEGSPFSQAVAINNQNEIVGMSTTESGDIHPTLWRLVRASGNRAPVAHAGGPYVGEEGSVVELDGSRSSDADGDALTFAWDFGDGATGGGATPEHTYADNGDYSVMLAVADPAGLSAAATTTAAIANVAPIVTPVPGAMLIERETYSASGSFTDPGADAWTATADYGDGGGRSPLALSAMSFDLEHQYRTSGTFMLAVSVSDDDGGVGVSEATVVVLTFQQATERLSDRVDELAESGELSDENAKALNAKLDAAIGQLDNGNEPTAVNQIGAFINQVEAFERSERLSAADANRLIGMARRIIRAIGTP